MGETGGGQAALPSQVGEQDTLMKIGFDESKGRLDSWIR
jgi:hypothetical protein